MGLNIKNSNISGDIVCGDKIIFNTSNTLEKFIWYIDNSEWRKLVDDQGRVSWVCEEDNLFQIRSSDNAEEFNEVWTMVFADKKAYRYVVQLMIGETEVENVSFVSLDGGRLFVPIPRIDFSNDKLVYYWDRKTLDYKISYIIGRYDFFRFNNIEIARIANIAIR